MLAAQRLDDNPCRPRHFKPPPPCAPVVGDERANQLLETCRTRLLAAAALFAFVFLVVVLRLTEIVLLAGGAAESHIGRLPQAAPPPAARADIVDRNGALLATMLPKPSLFANSKALLAAGQDPDEAAGKLAALLPEKTPGEIRAKLVSSKSFVYLKRSLTPRQQYAINRLGIPGLDFTPEERRFYPYGDLAAHVVGYCGIDNEGLAGVERGLDGAMKGRSEPLELSLDARVQFILREELTRVVGEFGAKGAAGIIMDVQTGEIIAMVSLPDFDPNRPGGTDPADKTPVEVSERIFNKITLGDYEMGSVFKIFNTAMALDSGVTSLTKGYDASHPIHIGRFTIEDYHGKHRWLSVPEIFMYSSNIGSAHMAVDAGAERQRAFLARLGLLKQVPIELDEVARPHYPAVWRPVNVMTIAYGHGIAVSPLHLITAVSAIVNGGVLHPPTLRKLPPGAVPPGEQVMSPKTSEQMRKLMRLVVEFGTAKLAAAPGYVVGGKTGTAEKNSGGRYLEKKLLSSFIGAFPIQEPRYAILTLVDEPHGTKESHGYATAGWTVAPATSRIIQRIAPILGVAPVDEASPAITRALTIESMQGKRIESY
jgi:cell division protein FtsI (penicillin-binding protein 3)